MIKRKNGEGSFKKLSNGKYEMRKMVGYKPNGRPNILKVRGTSETSCIRKMKEKEWNAKMSHAFLNKEIIKEMTVTDLCLAHFQSDLDRKDHLKPKAADRRESTINNQIQPSNFGHYLALDVTPEDIEVHIESLIDKQYSVSTIEKTLNVLNAAYKWAKKRSYIDYNPCDKVFDDLKDRLDKLETRNSSDGIIKILSDEEIFLIEAYVIDSKNSCKKYEYIFSLSVLLLLYTGMRVGEMCALLWEDWNEESSTIMINKTRYVAKNRNITTEKYQPNEGTVKNDRSRTIQLSGKAQRVIKELKTLTYNGFSSGYIILNRNKTPTNPSNYDSNIRNFYDKVGLSKNVSGAHILRRTRATKMYLEGCSIEDIAAYLGDSPGTILKHYISRTKTIKAGDKILNVVTYPQPKNK